MKKIISLVALVFIFTSFTYDSFKDEQKRYPRVREAYADKEELVKELLAKNSIETGELRIYLRAFKTEKKIELWAKNASDNAYKLIKVYNICRTSGGLGPKRVQGDRQIPEGFYHISKFNPHSNFYLSLGINYPNKSDRILADKQKPGGDIFIHGACVTIGCLPITDDMIKEVYVFCVEAKDNGQQNIPVTIFPAKMTDNKHDALISRYNTDNDKLGLWKDLKDGYDIFNETKSLPEIGFLDNGRHRVKR